MATLTVRRLEEIDRDWLKRESLSKGISMEEYVRRMIRTARVANMQAFGDVLAGMNASLDDETRAVLGDPLSIERPSPPARDDAFPRDEDDTPVRAAS